MYRKILIATDGSEHSDKAVLTGVELAKQLGAAITAVHVTEPWATDFPLELTKEPFWVEYDAACATQAGTILQAVAPKAGDAGVGVHSSPRAKPVPRRRHS